MLTNTKENGRYVDTLVEVHKCVIEIYVVIIALIMKIQPFEIFCHVSSYIHFKGA
jgi:hypothetical protein